MALIRIPTPLRNLTSGEAEVAVSARSVGEALRVLDQRFAGIGQRLFDDKGNVRRFVNVYLNDEDIRFLQNLETPMNESDQLSIVPAIAGG
jgi:molybdopterin converting factor small subunit